MHLELVELLRCPNDHPSGVLVAAADEIENRYVMSGVLGCPECFAEYAVRAGVTHFAARMPNVPKRSVATVDVDHDAAMRLAAQVGLSAGRTVFALVGFPIEMAIAMREIVAARVLVLNAPQAASASDMSIAAASAVAPLGIAICHEVLPLVARKFDGIAIAQGEISTPLVDHAVLALRPGARLVAPVQTIVPIGMRELVRDDRVWVAEREAVTTKPIPLVRR